MGTYPLLGKAQQATKASMSELAKIDNSQLFPVKSIELAPQVTKALAQLTEVQPLFKIWNRSHSDLAWNLMNLDHQGDARNLRQIGAELARKRNALVEANYVYKENLVNAEIYEEKAEKQIGANKAKSLLLAEKERAFAVMKHEAIQGCTKDINVLKSSYDKILAAIIKKYGKFDEEVFETEEKEYWIKTFYILAMRDVRECRIIRTGAQRDLEQLGIDPNEALNEINNFLAFVNQALLKGQSIGSGVQEDFLNGIVAKHINKIDKRLELRGADKSHWMLEEKV
jgi:hypothetical protein